MDPSAPLRHLTPLDRLIAGASRALGAIGAAPGASRPTPRPRRDTVGDPLSDEDRQLAGALMRVNHVGEVCAQALYEGQAATTRDPRLERFFRDAAAEEGDHLAWTRERLDELGARPSLLNPLWYAGAFAIGALAGRAGDRYSLGFMVETERQVEHHLAGHLERLPAGDDASRAIVDQMKRDEAGHADHAEALGAARLPEPVRVVMQLAAKVMTEAAHRI
ncbi:MAG: 2-polyprenyl-3-methyl-6-methoxy-1,4-benzoquinone monooxygenase [Burkholderiales bacterium]|jgi:ubiquinone biosynthesis monooxygenase Coq7